MGGANADLAKAAHMTLGISRVTALIAFAIAIVILAQGISAPFVKDAEPQAGQWIQDVAAGRGLLIPRDYYGELARKPPLFYWTAGAIVAMSGGRVDEVTARVASTVAGAVVAILALIWAATFLDISSGWISFLFLLGSYAFTSRGTLALEDMMMVAFMFGAWCLLYQAIEKGAARATMIAIGVALGLGILSKGPVAIVIPAFGALIYLLMTRRSIVAQIRQPWPWIVAAIAIAIALLWYIPALLAHGGEVSRIIFQENAGHFLPASAGGTGEAARPFYYIAIKMIGGVTPLNFFFPALAVAFITGSFVSEVRKPLLFQASFVIAIVIFFSIASAKRDDYVLPAVPSLAILFAALFTSLRSDSNLIARRLRDTAAIIVALVAVAAIADLSLAGGSEILMRNINPIDLAAVGVCLGYARTLNIGFVAAAIAILSGAGLISYGVLRREPPKTAIGLAAISIVGVLTFTAVIRPELSRMRTLKFAAADISRIAGTKPIYAVNEESELSFYLGHAVPQIIVERGAIRSVEAPSYLFAYPGDLRRVGALQNRLKQVAQWQRLGKAGPPALYEIQPLDSLKPATPTDK
jgi:Dolichyl-phosphate-mannose-protein mannosyltransferase